jgi:predicted nuclease of restriction endonuclease-like (RecB) superfamily
VHDEAARKWYEKEAYEQTWSVRTLQRNIDTQYYYRLVQSKDKEPVEHEMKEKTLTYQQDKLEFIKNPIVVEFLGLTPDISFTETKFEACIITNLQELYKETNLISDQEVAIWQKIRCFPANQRMLSTRLLYQKKAKNT